MLPPPQRLIPCIISPVRCISEGGIHFRQNYTPETSSTRQERKNSPAIDNRKQAEKPRALHHAFFNYRLNHRGDKRYIVSPAKPTLTLLTICITGIGKCLLQTYLGRPNHTVIGSVRDKTSQLAQELQTLPTAPGTRLILVKIESTAPGDPAEAVKDMEAAGIDHIDVVIANAGGLREIVAPLDSVTAEDITETFQTNALGPLLLFQAVRPLLQKSQAAPKWISISSAIGSIGLMPTYHSHLAPAYGISKASLNWLTMAAHCGNPWLIALCINPG